MVNGLGVVSSKTATADDEFLAGLYEMIYKRLRISSFFLIFTYPGFFFVDFFLFQGFENLIYRVVLAIVHALGFLGSVLFLAKWRRAEKGVPRRVLYGYVIFYLLLGAIASINSQQLDGNIYAYVLILLACSVLFPIEPRKFVKGLAAVHVIFVAGLIALGQDSGSMLIKLVNSTGSAGFSILILWTFYGLRKNDFTVNDRLRKSEGNFRRLFNFNPNPLILLHSETKEIILANRQAIDFFKIEMKEEGGEDSSVLFGNPVESAKVIRELQAHGKIVNYEMQLDEKWLLLNVELVDYHDKPCVLIGATDITERKKAEERLQEYALYDAQTGALNRRSGIDILNAKIESGSEDFVVCYIDIDGLKVVNDRFGHSAGDDLIFTSCHVIQQHLDQMDIIFRIGGDEFVVIFSNKTKDQAAKIWSEIEDGLEEAAKTKPFPVSASHGLCEYRKDYKNDPQTLLEEADRNMYLEKRDKHDREKGAVCVYLSGDEVKA